MSIQSSVLIRNLIVLVSVFLVLAIYYLVHIGNNYIDGSKRIRISKKKSSTYINWINIYLYFYLLSKRYGILSDTIYTIVISAVLAYLFNPIINYFEKHNISRGLGVFYCIYYNYWSYIYPILFSHT